MSRVLNPEEIADRDRKELAEMGCLYCELSAVLECLDNAIDDVGDSDADHPVTMDHVKALAMAAIRLNREIGRQAGAA